MEKRKFNRLIKKIKYDQSALTELYREYYPRIQYHLYGKFGRRVEAEEIAQRVFLKLMEMDDTKDIEYPTAWLYKMADNEALDCIRRAGREAPLEEASMDFDVDSVHVRADIKAALGKLDPVSARILYLHIWEGYSYKEIAALLNINYSSVRTRAVRSLQDLKKILREK